MAAKKAATKKPLPKSVGRPTPYQPRYCQQLITHMAQGYSFESFAGKLRVARSTIYKWVDDFPAFSDAKSIAMEASRFTWEKIGIKIAKTGVGNPTSFVFNMKNRFKDDWRDKHEVDQTVKQETTIIDWTGQQLGEGGQ